LQQLLLTSGLLGCEKGTTELCNFLQSSLFQFSCINHNLFLPDFTLENHCKATFDDK